MTLVLSLALGGLFVLVAIMIFAAVFGGVKRLLEVWWGM